MLAYAAEIDSADNHNLIGDMFKGSVEVSLHIVRNACKHLAVRTRNSLRRLSKPLALGVVADGREDLTHSSFNSG